MSARRKKDPDLSTLLRFIAEQESLVITLDEFPDVPEDKLRAMLAQAADALASRAGPPQTSLSFVSDVRVPDAGAPSVDARTAVARNSDVPRPPAEISGRAASKSSSRRVVVNTDGASRGNPGLAGAGWVIVGPDGELMVRGRAFLGKKTNNEAEYEAVIRALGAAAEIGANEVELRSDSELLVRQINGQYQVRNERIAVLHGRVRELMRQFRRVTAKHVPREANRAADALANEAIDEARPAPGPR